MGSSGESTTYGVSLDRGDLELDGVLALLEDGEEVNVSIRQHERGRYELVIPAAVEEEPRRGAPTAD